MRSGSAFVRLALGFARVGCPEWVTQDAVKPGIHGVGTQWIRGFMAFHGVRRRDLGGGRGRVGGGEYGMMWDKGGVWGRGVI